MNINDLIAIVKKKLENEIDIESIKIEDKSFLHVGHKSNDKKKYHLKVSKELSKMTKIQSTKKIYKILNKELKNNIHSIQILII